MVVTRLIINLSSFLTSSLKKLSWALQTFSHNGNNLQSMYTHTHTLHECTVVGDIQE